MMDQAGTWADGHDFSTLPRTTLKDATEALIRRSLLSGAMKPGEVYSANSLAARLGISNSPAREAMMALVGKNLLELVRNRGFRVVELSREDRREVYELRMLIEVEAVRRVAEAGVTPDQAAHLRGLARQGLAAARSQDTLDYLEMDQRFHVELVDLLGNSRWTAIVENLRDQSRINGAYFNLKDSGHQEESAQEHSAIAEAVIAGDAGRAADLMTRHLDYAKP